MARPLRIVAAALLALGALTSLSVAQIPIPPRQDRSIHDLAGVLSPQTIQTLEARHTELFQKTGVSIVVVTVPSLQGEPIDDFAVRVGKEWGAGRKGEDRGIVIALSTGDRRVFIATGYGVEGFLPDGKVGGILDDYVIPSLKSNNYSKGIDLGSAALAQAAAEEYHVTLTGLPELRRRGLSRGQGFIATLLFLIVFVIVLISAMRNARRGGRGTAETLLWMLLMSGQGRGRGRGGGWGGGGFGGSGGFGGFGGGGFGGGGAGRGF
jgi:uncharacterized protein